MTVRDVMYSVYDRNGDRFDYIEGDVSYWLTYDRELDTLTVNRSAYTDEPQEPQHEAVFFRPVRYTVEFVEST